MTAADVAPTDERRTSGVVEPESQPSSRPSSRPGSAHGGYGGTGGDSSRYFEQAMFPSTWCPTQRDADSLTHTNPCLFLCTENCPCYMFFTTCVCVHACVRARGLCVCACVCARSYAWLCVCTCILVSVCWCLFVCFAYSFVAAPPAGRPNRGGVRRKTPDGRGLHTPFHSLPSLACTGKFERSVCRLH